MVENLLVALLFSVVGFLSIIMMILYLFREKKTERMPETVRYDYEGTSSNPKLDTHIDRNAYFHTLVPSYRGAMVGLHNDRRKNKRR
jgi:hypothetical protein